MNGFVSVDLVILNLCIHKLFQRLNSFSKILKENTSEVEQWFPKPKVKGSNPFFLVGTPISFFKKPSFLRIKSYFF